MFVSAVHHVAIIVSSESSLRFYELLGFKESFRKVRRFDTVVLMDGFEIQLEIFIDRRHPQHPSGLDEPIGFRHFALRTLEPLETEIERLKGVFCNEGFDIKFGTIMKDWTGVKFCFVRDFDGLNIELRE